VGTALLQGGLQCRVRALEPMLDVGVPSDTSAAAERRGLVVKTVAGVSKAGLLRKMPHLR